MFYPSLEELIKRTDNRFALVIIAAKRARHIMKEHSNNEQPMNAVSKAFEDIANGKIRFERMKTGIK